MKNILVFSIESSLGAVIISIMAIAFIVLLFISMENFNSDVDILSSNYGQVGADQQTKFISPFEKSLINSWLGEQGLKIPKGKGYQYILTEYPDRPWLKVLE